MYQPDVRVQRLNAFLTRAGNNLQAQKLALEIFIDEEENILNQHPDGPQHRSLALDQAKSALRSLQQPGLTAQVPTLPFFQQAATSAAAQAQAETQPTSRSLQF